MPPIKRPLQYAETGADVTAVQQGLHRAGFTTNARNGSYGDKTVNDMAAFQKSVGIQPTGSMGQASLDALWPRMSGDQQQGYLSYKPTAPKLLRCLYSGDTGDDVQAVQQMLYRAGIGATNAKNGNYGQKSVADMIALQRKYGISASGNMGGPSWTQLAQFATDSDMALYTGATVPSAPPAGDAMRQSLVSSARWSIANGPNSHYKQSRPYPLKLVLPFDTDCSGSTSCFYCVSGAPDPNGRGYDGRGFTGTQRQNGKQVSHSDARNGDLVFYGDTEGSQHVTMLIDVKNWRVYSFGSNPPSERAADYRPIDMIRTYF